MQLAQLARLRVQILSLNASLWRNGQGVLLVHVLVTVWQGVLSVMRMISVWTTLQAPAAVSFYLVILVHVIC